MATADSMERSGVKKTAKPKVTTSKDGKPAYLTQDIGPNFARDARTKLLEAEAYAKAKREAAATPAKATAPSKPKGPSSLDAYTQAIQRMLQGGDYRTSQDELMGRLNTMYGQSQTNIGSAMDNLSSFLSGQANPFSNFQAQQAQVAPQLGELLASQGASQTPVQQLAATIQGENAGQATAFQNLANTLGALYGAQQQGAIQDVAAQRANMLGALEGQRGAFAQQLESQAMGNRDDLMKLLLAALGKGGKLGKGGLGMGTR